MLGCGGTIARHVDQGYLAPLVVIGMGISMVEKHVMPDHDGFESLDSSFSMRATDFIEMSRCIYLADQALGSWRNEDVHLGDGQAALKWQENSISAHSIRDLEVGHILSLDDIIMYRSGDGLSPTLVEKYLGKCLRKNY